MTFPARYSAPARHSATVVLVCLTQLIPMGESAQVSSEEQVASVGETLEQLTSRDFSVRIAAQQQLRTMTPDEIAEVARQVSDHPSAEVCARLMAILEAQYVSAEHEVAQAASDALERINEEQRILAAESARDILERRWSTRLEFVQKDLRAMGAILDSQNSTGFPQLPFPGTHGNSELQILLNEAWTGGDKGIAVFERLGNVIGPDLRTRMKVGVFLLPQHPLTEEQENDLRNAMGDTRVVHRAAVVLGIIGTASPDPDLPGVLVRNVKPGSSADGPEESRLRTGDLLTHIDERPLEDFEKLVRELFKYSPGDKVKIRVVRGLGPLGFRFRGAPESPNDNLETRVLEITLKGWLEDQESADLPSE